MSRARLPYAAAVGLAEGGWITVLYLLIDAMANVRPVFGLGVFAVVAGSTCLLADRIDRVVGRRAAVFVVLLVGGGLVGVGLALAVGAAAAVAGDAVVGSGQPVEPGAALLGLAALRGFLRAGAIRDPGEASRPFFRGLLGLCAMWILAGALDPSLRAGFRETAVVPTLAFIGGGIMATGLARADLAASGVGADPHSNRAWSAALVGLAAALAVAALPLGSGAERILAAAIAWPLTGPLLLVGLIAARLVIPSRISILRSASEHAVGLVIVLGVLLLVAIVLPPPAPTAGGPAGLAGTGASAQPRSQVFDIVVALLVVAAIAGTLLYLARAWRANARTTLGADGRDLRTDIRDPADDDAGPGLARRLRALVHRQRPGDAVTAYLAALRLLEGRDGLGRWPQETPAAHARRLHDVGAGTLELDLLAADFELARWGGRTISPAEDRRAIGRWQRLRARLTERPRGGA